MTRRSTIVAAVSVGAAAVAVAVGIWYALNSSDPPSVIIYDLKTSGQNRPFLLVPVKIPAGKQRPAVDVWQNLFTGLSKDQASKAFLQRLYGGFPVEVVVAAPATDQPPGEGFSIVLRIDPKPGETDWGKMRIPGRIDEPVECLLGKLDCTRIARLRIAKTDPPAREAAAKVLQDQLLNFDLDALVMAANEYLLREQMGWRLVRGLGMTSDRLKGLSQDPVEVQRELDHQVDELVKQYSQQGKDR